MDAGVQLPDSDLTGLVVCRWVRPTCEVVGMWGGFTGTGVKTIVPAKATAKVVCRLVPEQHPEEIIKVALLKLGWLHASLKKCSSAS